MRAKIVSFLDYVTAAVIYMTVSATVFDGFRVRLGDFRFSAESPVRLFVASLILLGIRHVLQPTPPFHRRVADGIRRVLASTSLRAALPPWIMLRLGTIAVGFLAVVLFGYGPTTLPFRWSENELVNLQARWDAGWYMGIAMEGYQWTPGSPGQQNIAFMPALPLLVRGAAKLLDHQWMLAGWLVSLLVPLLSLVYLHRLARQLGLEDQQRGIALLLFAAYPFAVFHGAIYTEALFTFAVMAAFLHQLRGEYLRAAMFAIVVGLVRPNGFLLSVPLGLLVVRTYLDSRRDTRPAVPTRSWVLSGLPAVAAVGGLAGFCVFSWQLTGDPLVWLRTHAAWGRAYSPVLDLVKYPALMIWQSGFVEFVRHDPMHVLNGLAVLLALAAVWPCYRRYGLAYAVFILVNVVPPMFAGGLLSIGRLTSTLFPVFLWLAVAVPARWAWPLAALFAMVQGLGAGLFYTWRRFL